MARTPSAIKAKKPKKLPPPTSLIVSARICGLLAGASDCVAKARVEIDDFVLRINKVEDLKMRSETKLSDVDMNAIKAVTMMMQRARNIISPLQARIREFADKV